MYCEIDIEHGPHLVAADLLTAIQPPALGADFPLANAYASSRRYKASPPAGSIFGQLTVRNCFVIARTLSGDVSTYHVEGLTPAVSARTLLEASEMFTMQLLAKINSDPKTQGKLLVIRLFEDTGFETGVEGQDLTWGRALLEQLSWKELQPKILAAVTAIPIIYFGLDKKTLLWSSLVSLGFFVAFGLVQATLKYSKNRGKITFVVRRS